MCYKNILLLFSTITIALSSCLSTGNYEKHHFIKNHTWQAADAKTFSINITDTNKAYYQYLYVQHQYNYLYSNLWIKIISQSPSGRVDTSKPIEIGLSLPNGRWLGSTAHKIANEKINISPNFGTRKFNERGTYQLRVMHIMREGPLNGIIKIGMGLEPALANTITTAP
jgi:gliding motility-associated lipoprotein GldH